MPRPSSNGHPFSLLLLLALVLIFTGDVATPRGPYWDTAGAVGVKDERWAEWAELERVPWSKGHGRMKDDLVSLAVNRSSWCECKILCQVELQCLSVGVRALGDDLVTCLLSHRRGQSKDLVYRPGFTQYQRIGVARVGDACANDTECYNSDIYSHCSEEKCQCKAGAELKDGICSVDCPSGWVKAELSERTECYYLSRQKAKSETAIEKCATIYPQRSKLASILDLEEQLALAAIMRRHLSWSDRILFGLTDHEGIYTYDVGGNPKAEGGEGDPVPRDEEPEVTFFAWGGNEPNNPTEHCVVMFQGYQWRWADVNCKFEYFYLCKLTIDV